MLTKQEKERLTTAVTNYWKEKSMINYCVNKALLIFEVRGKIVPIDKHSVETRFCFGYSDYIPNDYESAWDMAHHAQTNERYFIRENHRRAEYADIISDLNNSRYVAYARPCYGSLNTTWSICFEDKYDLECGKKLPDHAFILTKEEVQAYKRKLAEACKLHHKKLVAYLKRYGLSKVESWTYWQDE